MAQPGHSFVFWEELNKSFSFPYAGVNLKLKYKKVMAGQGSSGNVIAALASFFIPGLGQLLQGRLFMAAFMFISASILWIVLLGWIIHLCQSWTLLRSDRGTAKPRMHMCHLRNGKRIPHI